MPGRDSEQDTAVSMKLQTGVSNQPLFVLFCPIFLLGAINSSRAAGAASICPALQLPPAEPGRWWKTILPTGIAPWPPAPWRSCQQRPRVTVHRPFPTLGDADPGGAAPRTHIRQHPSPGSAHDSWGWEPRDGVPGIQAPHPTWRRAIAHSTCRRAAAVCSVPNRRGGNRGWGLANTPRPRRVPRVPFDLASDRSQQEGEKMPRCSQTVL